MAGGKKYAVLVGCNYPETSGQLDGCSNDALKMRQLLLSDYGFEPANIVLMTDVPIPQKYVTPLDYVVASSYSPDKPDDHDFNFGLLEPTGWNIRRKIREMVDRARAGDVLYFHFSGHGTTIPQIDELPATTAIIPIDHNLITVADFRDLLRDLPKEASFTFLSDSCAVSGGIIDKKIEQAGPVDKNKEKIDDPVDPSAPEDNIKFMPYETILTHLSAIAPTPSSDSSLDDITTSPNIYTLLTSVFGASSGFLSSQPESNIVLPDHSGILLAGCEEYETSKDRPAYGGREAHGIFSDAVLRVLKEHEDSIYVSNKELILRTREIIPTRIQVPCLYCSNDNVNARFLG